jgi:hypothetical protein
MAKVEISPLLKTNHKQKEPPVGLGGWFTIIIIGLILTIVANVAMTPQLLPNLVYYPLYLIVFLSICLINEVMLSAVILFFIYKRNIIFRKLFVIQTCILIVCAFILLFISYLFNVSSGFSITGVLARILWTTYLFRSERVHNTFIGVKSINQTLTENEESLN